MKNMTEEDEKLLKLYENRVIRLSELIHEYDEYITRWDGINLYFGEIEEENTTTPYFALEFYKHVVKLGYNKQPTAYRNNTERRFDFTLENLDLAIDRYRKKVAYEKDKRTEGS